MKFHFLTRDSGPGEDYPRIGWIAPLPVEADKLWTQYGNLHASEYPEIILSGHDGVWQLYLSAIDSGRTDSLVGRGRIIRMSLYITGRVDEGERAVGLIGQFLHETLSKTSPSTVLKDLFSSEINPGDPVKWKDLSVAEQERISDRILSRLTNIPHRMPSQNSMESAWMGGCTAENMERFAAHCRAILSGMYDGTALSLANLSSSEINKVLNKVGGTERIAVLLSTIDEKDSSCRKISTPSMTSSCVRRSAADRPKEDPQKKLKRGLIVGATTAGAILVASLLARGLLKKTEAPSTRGDKPGCAAEMVSGGATNTSAFPSTNNRQPYAQP